MSTIRFIGTTFEQGLRTPNYVNGRTLHAEDLRSDQAATLARLASLGTAAGSGIVVGLTVRQTPGSNNSLQVDPGIGINRRGDLMQLAGSAATLSLVIAPETSTILGSAGLFQPCELATPGEHVVITTGAYLLTMTPVSRLEGTTPLTTAASRGNTVDCAAKWVVEGLEFKAIRLNGFGTNGTDAESDANTRRNRLAHWVYGSPSHRLVRYTAGLTPQAFLDRIAADLTPCDLPLAVFYWDNGAIGFVDNWAARRDVAAGFPAPDWDRLIGDERRGEGQARLLQFQEQLERIQQTTTNLASVSANATFRFLPPVGFLPIRLPQSGTGTLQNAIRATMADFLNRARFSLPVPGGLFPLVQQDIENQLTAHFTGRVATRMAANGFDVFVFFGQDRLRNIVLVDPITLDKALVHSWYDQSIDLAASAAIDVYLVRASFQQQLDAVLVYTIDSEGFPTIQASSVFGIPIILPGALLAALWVQTGMRTQTLARIGPDASAVLAQVQQPNTPLIQAAFVRPEEPPQVIGGDNF